jgi:hypothetical protein
MVLVQASQQLSAVGLQVVLELVVGPSAGLGAGEGGDKGIEGGAGGAAGVGPSSWESFGQAVSLSLS